MYAMIGLIQPCFSLAGHLLVKNSACRFLGEYPATRAPTSTPDYIAPTVVALSDPTPTTIRPTSTPFSTLLPDLPTHTPTPTTIESFLSPDGSRLAFVQNLGSLIIQEAGGQQRELVVTNEISSLAWFPDGKHITYSDRGTSQPPMVRQYRLWIVNVETGAKHQIDIKHVPRPGAVPCISPGGDYLYFMAPSGAMRAS